MPPTLALVLWFVLLLGLFWFDRAKIQGTSWTLWVPLIWIFIVASRLPSQWIGMEMSGGVEAFEEGNPLDRAVLFTLIVLAIGVLVSRSFKWDAFFARNAALAAYLLFALISISWSDFPLVAFKRWFRDLGQYFVLLVALSDPRPADAIRTLIRRLSYLLIPLSVVLVKYFPDMSRQYDEWTGAATYAGATTSKNMLGEACLVSGIFFFWDTVSRWKDRKDRQTKKILAVNFAFLAMTLWLLNLCDSATSRLCLGLGCLIILAVRSKMGEWRLGLLTAMIPTCFVLYVILAYGFNLNAYVAEAVGRDPTLTSRTVIWNLVLSMKTNPLVGTGYESFWLGPRLEYIWAHFHRGLNEAHNGYIEVYLNLGLIGLCLLIGFLLATYRAICRGLKDSVTLASFSLALWTVILFYGMSEAAFRGGLLWLAFLLAVIVVPARAKEPAPAVASAGAKATNRFSRLPLESVGRHR